MLQYGLCLVLFDSLGHHVQYVVHDGDAQLQIVVRLDSLFGDRFGDALGVSALELTREQIAQPSFEQRDAPPRRPKAAAGSLAHRTRVKSVVEQVFEVLAHSYLFHQLVLVSVHAGQLAHVGEYVLEAVGQLKRVHIAEPVLDVRVVEIFAVNEQIEHVVALAAHLEARFDPVESGRLKKFCRLERTKEVAFFLGLWMPMVQRVQHKVLEQLLIGHSHFDRMTGRTVFSGNVDGASRIARPLIVGTAGPEQRDAVGRVVGVERRVA
ncbi:hypothetical protein BpHYR1_029175 [Brachionus plicatilis]|uniref:Uncharacterized protein n=1 Tax=Brachionus plicatilis TaxID=10195 RepID=A0A3M7T444_BRAPC|nr:hypothetical protein BpHYR1_029175 [Brachionus plicatilis]